MGRMWDYLGPSLKLITTGSTSEDDLRKLPNWECARSSDPIYHISRSATARWHLELKAIQQFILR
jgi:hypothetical protein